MNTSIQTDSTTDAWGHYPSQTIRYDLIATNGVRVLIDELDQAVCLVPSTSHPGTDHMIAITKGGTSDCDCKAFVHRGTCRHGKLAQNAHYQMRSELYYIHRYSNPNVSGDEQRYGAGLLDIITWSAAKAKAANATEAA